MEKTPAELESENRRLLEENVRLKKALQDFQDFDHLNWRLFSSLSTRLQIHSASIKAAVSSLLDRNIFWDVSAQQEFLEAISQSVDDISNLMTHVALANLLQVGNLEVTRKPYELHELMTAVQERVMQACGQPLVYTDTVPKGSLVSVDYRYFVHALSTLFTVVGVGGAGRVVLEVAPGHFKLSIGGIAQPALQVIDDILSEQWSSYSMQSGLPAEKVFALLLAIRLMFHQGIQLTREDLQMDVLKIGIPE